MLASIVLITMPIDSVSWSRNAWCAGLKRSSDASSSTPRTSPSKTTGSTSTSIAAFSPRPGGDAEGVARHVGQQDLLLVDRALADQPLAELDLLAVRALAARGVAGEQLQLRHARARCVST